MSTIVMARALHSTGLGQIAVSTSTANSAYGLIRLGLDSGTHVATASLSAECDRTELEEILGTAFASFAAMALVGAGGITALAHSIARAMFSRPDLAQFVMAGGVLLFGQVIAQCAYVCFAGLHDFRSYVRINAISALVTTVLTLGAALLLGPLATAWTMATSQCITASWLISSWLAKARRAGLAIRPSFSPRVLRAILRIGLPFYVAGLMIPALDYYAQAWVVRGYGIASLGDLRVIAALVALVTFLPGALNGPMISAFARAHAQEAGADAAFVTNLRAVWTLALASSLGVGFLWPVLVGKLFGSGFFEARMFGSIALVTAGAICLRNVVANMLLGTNRQFTLLATNSVEALTFAAAAASFIPRLGLQGYLVAQCAGTIAPLALLWCASAVRRRGIASMIVAPAVLSVTSLVLMVFLNSTVGDPILRFAVFAGLLPVFVILWLAVVVGAEERGQLREIASRLRRFVPGGT